MRRIPREFSFCGALVSVALIVLGLVCRPAYAAPRSLRLPLDKESWYAIRWENQLVGFSHFAVDRSVELAGDPVYYVTSNSRLKLGPGAGNEVSFEAKLLLKQSTLNPSLFICRQTQGRSVIELECLFTSKVVAQKNRTLQPRVEEVTSTVNVEGPAYLVFNNVWGRVDTFLEHYMVLLAAWDANGGKDGLPVYDPVLRGTDRVHIQSEGTATVQLPGREAPARVFVISDPRRQPLARIYASEQNARILRLDDLHAGLTFTLSDARVEALVKKSVGVNLYKNRVEFSNVFFPNASKLRSFSAQLDIRVGGQPLLDRDICGFKQRFKGSVSEGVVKGTVDVSSDAVTVKKPLLFPRRQPFDGQLAAYVAPEPGIESRDEEMHSKASEVAWRSRTFWDAARKINQWVHEKVADGLTMPSGRYALQHMTANRESKALLVVALLRSVNIPARRVGGILFDEGNFVAHNWVEVYLGDTDGWVALDPTTGEEGTLGATHVALWENGDLSSLAVKVLSYAPRPPERVAFFNHELAWPVGEQRTYSVIHGGKEVGRETARVKGLTTLNGKDAYEMDFTADITIDNKHTLASSRLLTDPNVLPREFTIDVNADGNRFTHRYEFGRNVVNETVNVGHEAMVQETPLSEGTYVIDPRFMAMRALVVGQFPNPGLGAKATVNVYDPETHNTQEMSLQIRQEEKMGVAGEERDTWRCEATDGISFYIDKKTAQVVRIEQPRQDLVLQLVESGTKI